MDQNDPSMNNNGKITEPIDLTDDVDYVLGIISADVKSACMSDQINMMSRIKPMRQASRFIDLSATDPGTGVPNWMVDADGYGAGIKLLSTFSNGTDVRAAWLGTLPSRWTYNRVQDDDWGRLEDFDGYNHTAIAPWGKSLYCPSKVLAGQRFSLYTTDRVQNADSVGFQHISVNGMQISDWHFGCYFSGGSSCVISNPKKLITMQDGQIMVNCEVEVGTTNNENVAGLYGGGGGGYLYTAYPLISYDVELNYRDSQGMFYDIPIAPAQFTIVSRGYIDDGNSYGYINGTSLYIKIYAKAVVDCTFRGSLYLVNPLGETMQEIPDVFLQVFGAGHDYSDPAVGFQELTISMEVTDNWRIRYRLEEDGEGGSYEGEIRVTNVIPE